MATPLPLPLRLRLRDYKMRRRRRARGWDGIMYDSGYERGVMIPHQQKNMMHDTLTRTRTKQKTYSGSGTQWLKRSPARGWRAQQLWKRWADVEVSRWCSLWYQIKIRRGNLGQNEAAPARGWHATSVGVGSNLTIPPLNMLKHRPWAISTISSMAWSSTRVVKKILYTSRSILDLGFPDGGRVLQRDVGPTPNPWDQSINPILLRLI